MSNYLLIGGLLLVMGFAYRSGARRSRAVAKSSSTHLHSLPSHYGTMVALACGLPALAFLALWALFQPVLVNWVVMSGAPADIAALSAPEIAQIVNRVSSIASGYGVADTPSAFEQAAASRLGTFLNIVSLAKIVVAASLAIGGFVFALRRIAPQFRARNVVESVIRVALILCSTVAILTTVGIVLSMLGETLRFFSFVNPLDFFFGLNWNPRFSSTGSASGGDYGLLPLLSGTLLITLIAMLVAVPIGLMIAIYLAEYAHPKVRTVTKPVIEILAGIPTIVFGFFALTTVGPFFAEIGELVGIQIRATSALTAGVVMGIMIIPFISSLSDDIITQVPGAMRDGSLALGSTRSETIKRVILPAALPGIVGAFLLAVSRAIGETMIVVLAAGNSPVLHGNPFEAVSTVTVSIVNQLTGDLDFASPQALVAFALGLTLFSITLGLNVVALYIVRKYREQYE